MATSGHRGSGVVGYNVQTAEAHRVMASFVLQKSADVDELVGDHAKPDPALHADLAFVAATVEPVPPHDHADAPLASGPPFLAIAEPPLLLFASALDTLG